MNLLDQINLTISKLIPPSTATKTLSDMWPVILPMIQEYLVEREKIANQSESKIAVLFRSEPARSAIYLGFVLGYLLKLLGPEDLASELLLVDLHESEPEEPHPHPS